ncbi:hypothetical protein SAMN05421771_2898 [Granulicella pectinivorans]|jgi:hypothetical protein|uniref:Uncharacterized protein n=1 Tax=Granulicella pectinivorans TaxID=474950 RepID=A0A1I6MKY3_9BACT|nr:hypothetical protein SAMN05421771_2898 [Granulicella pectinivorans]
MTVVTTMMTVVLSFRWDNRTNQHNQRNRAEQQMTNLHGTLLKNSPDINPDIDLDG